MIIYLAIDYFFENWDSEDERQLWMGIFPYVENQQELEEWIENHSEDGKQIQYRLMSGVDNTKFDNFIPITLPMDTNLSVHLASDNGEELNVSLNRTEQFIVTDPDLFRKLNEAEGLTPIKEQVEDPATDGLKKVDKDAYAIALVKALKDMHQKEPENLPIWLMLAFEIGQRRKFSDRCMSDFGPFISVSHPDDTGPNQNYVTNLHCLSGLMLPLGNDIELLNRVTKATVNFEISGASTKSVYLHQGQQEQIALRRFFETISKSFKEPDRQLQWGADMANRVYAIPSGQLFKQEYLRGIDGLTLFRRPRDGKKTQTNVDISYEHLERLVVRYNVEGTAEHPRSPANIVFKPITTFDLQGALYRSFPNKLADGSESKKVIIEITAQPHDIQRWHSITSELYENSQNIPQLQDKFRIYKISDEEDFELLDIDWMTLFKFPWEERQTPVVLMCASTNISGRYIALMDVDRRRSLPLELKGTNINQDPLGPRWEYRHTSTANFQFDALELTSDLEGLETENLVVSTYSDNEYQFELAQSARRIEGVAKIGIEAITAIEDPNAINAETEYGIDFINHNTANYVEEWRGSRNFLNSSSESTPDFFKQDRCFNNQMDCNWYTFHYRFTSPTSARPELNDVRGFYRDIYSKLGLNRTIHLDLEHTYGTRLPFKTDEGHTQSTYLDEPILHPADVNEQLPNDEQVSFIWIFYDDKGTDELFELKFDRKLLNRDWINNQPENIRGKLLESHIEAWQSVAELSRADQITLVCEAYRFNFHPALLNEEPSVGNGLVLTQSPITFDVTQSVKNELSDWLNGTADLPLEVWTQKIPYNGVALWKSSHVIRCYLTISRSSELYPPLSDNWSIVTRPTEVPYGNPENLVDENGSVVIPVNNTATNEMMKHWMTELKQTSSYLDAEIDRSITKDRIERYRALLGSGPQEGPAPTESKAWIIPEGQADSSGEANLIVLPIGFRPFKKDHYFGETTVKQVRAYFTMLQHAIDLKSEFWAKEFTESDWLSLLKNWDSKSNIGSALHQAYTILCCNAADTLFPVPDTSNSSNLQQHVLNTAIAVKTQTQIYAVINQEIISRISRNPSTFAKNKAFIYTRLTGKGISRIAPSDFYLIKVEKEIASNLGLAGVPVINDEFSANYSQGLTSVANTNWFGFLEDLDDSVYDNDFKITNINLSTIEDVLEENDEPSGVIEDNVIYIPDKKPQDLQNPRSASEIFLPSRRLVQKPVNIITGMFKIAQKKTDFEQAFPCKQKRDFNAFLDGLSKDHQEGNRTISRIASNSTPRSEEIDDVIISCLLTVKGDEEFETDLLNGLINDAFYIHIDEEVVELTTDQTEPVPKSIESAFNLVISKDVDNHDLSDVISPDTLQYVSRVISNKEAQVGEPTNYVTKFVIQDDRNGAPEVTIKENYAVRAVEIHIFQAETEGIDVEDVLYIWLNIELPVWKPRYVRLSQSRNFTLTNRQFAEEFGMLSIQKSNGFFPRSAIVKSLRDRKAVEIPNSNSLTARRFLNHALIDYKILAELGEVGGSQQFIVNITLNEIIEPTFPIRGPNVNNDFVDKLGVFPIENIRISKPEDWDMSTFNWFPDADELSIDVEWRRLDTNDILFRVEGLRVLKID